MGVIEGDTDEQRRFNGKYLEQIRQNSKLRVPWRTEDKAKMAAWLAHHRHSKSTICSNERELSGLDKSIGIDPSVLHQKHRILLKKKMVSSMRYALDTLLQQERVSEYWDPSAKVTRLRWPDELVRELTAGVSEVVQSIISEGTHRQDPPEPELHIISDDDDADFKDWEGDVEMGNLIQTLEQTGLFEAGHIEPTTTRQTDPTQSSGLPPPISPLQVSSQQVSEMPPAQAFGPPALCSHPQIDPVIQSIVDDQHRQSALRQAFETKLVSGLETFATRLRNEVKQALTAKDTTGQETAQPEVANSHDAHARFQAQAQLERAEIQQEQRQEQRRRDSELKRRKQELDEEERLIQERQRKNAEDRDKALQEQHQLEERQVKMRQEYLKEIQRQCDDFKLKQSQLLILSERAPEKYHDDPPAQQQHDPTSSRISTPSPSPLLGTQSEGISRTQNMLRFSLFDSQSSRPAAVRAPMFELPRPDTSLSEHKRRLAALLDTRPAPARDGESTGRLPDTQLLGRLDEMPPREEDPDIYSPPTPRPSFVGGRSAFRAPDVETAVAVPPLLSRLGADSLGDESLSNTERTPEDYYLDHRYNGPSTSMWEVLQAEAVGEPRRPDGAWFNPMEFNRGFTGDSSPTGTGFSTARDIPRSIPWSPKSSALDPRTPTPVQLAITKHTSAPGSP